jgi:hypothetical protein
MTIRPLLLLLLSACATSPSPGQLHQASAAMPAPAPAPSFPRPGFTPAGAGASHGGLVQPRPEVARSSNWRPAGPRPEIMAPDGVRASSDPLKESLLLTSYLPDLQGLPDPRPFANLCAAEMNRALADLPPDLMKAVNDGELDASFAQLPCLAGWLYQICAERHLPARAGEPGVDVVAALKDARETAVARCGKHGDTPAVRMVLAAVRRSKSHLH